MTINVKITPKNKHESADRMIRRFIKRTKKEKIIESVRDRQYYTKPSDVRRAKKRKAKRLHGKEMQKQRAAETRKN